MVFYMYPVDKCDVDKKDELIQFRQKYSQWIVWYETDPHHDICSQLHTLMWEDAAYRAFKEARRFASEQGPTASINGMLSEFLDRGYVAGQILAMCRVTEDGKSVISLRRMLNDIKKNRHLLTRENFVCHDGLPYDYSQVQHNEDLALTPEQGGPRWRSRERSSDRDTSQRTHEAFDRLSGVDASNRSRGDRIDERVFETIKGWLDAPILVALKDRRDKFVAHAAGEPSRQLVSLNDGFGEILLGEIEEAQRTVIRIANAIGELLQRSVGGPVPTAQFDVFENLNFPFIPGEHMKKMSDWWDQYSCDREAWARERANLLTGQIMPQET